MSTRATQTRQPGDVFQEEVVQDHDVCRNCYRLLFDRIKAPRTKALDHITDLRFPRKDSTDDDASGLFCRCGCSPGTQIQQPRDLGTTVDHARNAARVLSAKGYDVDLDVLVDVVEDMKKDPEHTGKEAEILGYAVSLAVREQPE